MATQPEAVVDAVAPVAQPVDPKPIDPTAFYADDQPKPDEPDDLPVEGEEAPTEQPVEQHDEQPAPLDPPTSWAKDAKDVFAGLPREAQEIIAAREADRERFVQSKAREAATTRQTVETEARGQIEQLSRQYAEQLEQYSGQFDVPPPDMRLLHSQDPQHNAAYYEQDRQYRIAQAQREQITQQAQQARQQADHLAQQQQQAALAEENATLAERLPEWSDPSARAKLLGDLEPIAAELGYSQELMSQAGATDILALNTALSWKRDADKYRQLMKQRMEPVRAAKQVPPTARGGAPSQPGAKPAGMLATLYPDDVPRNRAG